MKTPLVILFSLFLVFNVLAQNLEYKDGRYYKKDMLYTGTHIEYYENNVVKIERHIKDGIEDGLVTLYYPNGQEQEHTIARPVLV